MGLKTGVIMQNSSPNTSHLSILLVLLTGLIFTSCSTNSKSSTEPTEETNNEFEFDDTFQVSNNGMTSYQIDGAVNPDLTLERGKTYRFNISAPGHPFIIKMIQSTGTGNAYSSGVSGNRTSQGTLSFTVPADAPDRLFYNCEFHMSMTGIINIVDNQS